MNRTTGLRSKQLFLALSFLAWYAPANAQTLQATASNTPPYTPQNLISNIFLGDGVEVTNITFNGTPAAVGYFTGGTPVIGLDRGIVMTTGAVESSGGLFGTIGCTETGVDWASTDNFNFANDLDLAALTTGDLYDLAIYSITFIPNSDTLRFRYCFASEEYPEFGCTDYNDVFGFFIQGPGYPGPTNIARIPGIGLPVAINNLHPQNPNDPTCTPLNAQFYNDNDLTDKQPTYDGFTDVFVAEAVVTPCQQYTIKLAIADVGDGAYDSGVFLEAKSFSTGSLRVELATVSLDGTVVEGCASGSVTFKLPNALSQNFNIDCKILGTATNGVDYQTISTNLSIPAGQTEITVPVVGIEDNIAEAPESIAFDVRVDPCNRDTFYLYFKDNALVKPNLRPDTTVCTGGQPIQLDGTVNVPQPPPPTFTNNQDYTIAPTNTPVNSPINVFGVQPAVLDSGVIRSVCLNITHGWDDDLHIFLISPGSQYLELSTQNGADGDNYTNTCFTPAATTPINSPGPVAPASAAPFTGDWLPEGPWSDLWDGDYPTNGTWRLQVRDDANGITGTLRDWTITFEPTYKVSYQWSPATGLNCPNCPVTTANPTQTTMYQLVATDSYGCSVTDTVTLNVVTALAAPVVTCTGSTNNSVTFGWTNVSGATGYQVNINGGGWTLVGNATTYTASNLQPGTSVAIQVQGLGSVNGCDGLIGTITCANCTAPALTTGASPVSCFGKSDGSVTVVPDGANPPYTFKLGTQTNATGIFQNLAAGSYVVTVTDATGCSGTTTVAVLSPEILTTTATIQQNVSCFGEDDGSAVATPAGGTAPFTYSWSAPGQTAAVATGLSAGNYSVTVTDAKGCTASGAVTLTQPTAMQFLTVQDSVSCNGGADGSATVTVSGGTSPYTYVWDNGATTPTANGLNAGSHIVSVSDALGCDATTFVLVMQPALLVIDSISVKNVLCFGVNNGTATVYPKGGVAPYKYQWNNAQTTKTAQNLGSGGITVTITDANGCTVTQSATLTAPPQLVVNLTNTNTSCNGVADADALATVSGGVAPYTYKWSSGQTTAAVGNLAAGAYTVTVTDKNGCTFTGSVTVGQPEAMQLTANVVNVSCFGGSNGQITAQPAGGVPPFSFAWSTSENTATVSGKTAGAYSVTVTDVNGCSKVLSQTITQPTELLLSSTAQPVKCAGSSEGAIELTATGGTPAYTIAWTGPNNFTSSQSSLSGLFAGTYNAVVTDKNGCSKTLSVEVAQPGVPLTLALPAVADTICFLATDGTATVVPSGGTPPYSYLWDANGQTAQKATGLISGTYNVTVTDANGCTQTNSTFIFQKEELFAFAEAAPPPCQGTPSGTAGVTAVFYGATSANLNNFSYLWSTTPPQSSAQVTGLQAGQTYTVTVTDKQGCSDTQTVTVGSAPEFFAAIQTTGNVKCHGGSDGWAVVNAVGGTPPYTYFWSAGNATDSLAQNLPAGTFKVTVTDSKGCPATISVTIVQPAALKLDILPTDVKCFGESSGSAKALPSGGTPPYQYLWWNGGLTQEIQNLSTGIVGLSLTDANGCQIIDSVEIEQPGTPINGSAEKRDPRCFGGHDGEISISATGGTPPYRYALDDKPFNGSPKQISIAAGTYTPKIMDKNGCVFELLPIEVTQRDPLVVELGPDITITLGESTQLLADITGAAGAVTYSWTAADSLWLSCLDCPDPVVDSLYYQNYFEVRVVDSLGCSASDRVQVVVEKPRKVFVPTAFTPNGDLTNDVLQVHGQSSAQALDFRVYDRWGELVFERAGFPLNDPGGWDGNFRGKPLDPGVYVWVLEVQYMDGVKEVFKGNTTLIR